MNTPLCMTLTALAALSPLVPSGHLSPVGKTTTAVTSPIPASQETLNLHLLISQELQKGSYLSTADLASINALTIPPYATFPYIDPAHPSFADGAAGQPQFITRTLLFTPEDASRDKTFHPIMTPEIQKTLKSIPVKSRSMR